MFASTGEKLDALEVFHPDRMASRILGMGDVLTLIERAEEAASEDETEAMEARMRKGQFTFDDFLQAQKMLRRMGPLQGVLKLIPGLGNQLSGVDMDERKLKQRRGDRALDDARASARVPHLIDGRRRQRLARGSGTSVEQVNQLLEARKMMEKMMKQMGKGKAAGLPSLPGGLPGQLGTAVLQRPQQSGGMSAKERARKKKAKRKASRR